MAVSRGNGGILVEFEPMSPEEIQRTMQFLLTQQAQFAADFEKLSVKTTTMTDAIVSLTGIVGRMAEHLQRHDEAMRKHDEAMRKHDEGFAELREYIKTVESHLDLIIEMFERHLREGHQPPPS